MLERQDIATIAAASRNGSWRTAVRYVLWSSLLLALVAAIDGLLSGFSPLRVLLLELVRLLGGFALLVYGIQIVGRLLGGKGRAGRLAYAIALFYVPVEMWLSLASLFLSLLPYWLGSALTAISLLLAWALLAVLAYRTVLACFEFDARWKAVATIIVGGLLALFMQGLLFTT